MNIRSFFAHHAHARVLAAGCVALAAGGVVLLRAADRDAAAQPPAAPPPHATPLPIVNVPAGQGATAPSVTVSDARVSLRASFAQRSVLADGTRQVYAALTLRGLELQRSQELHAPSAIAVVLDVSGSMEGEKLAQARNAVASLVQQMRDQDQIALVTYSDDVRVVQPLARVRDVRNQLLATIPTIRSEGGTQIPRGLEAGARALGEAASGYARRVVLISDGLDGSGVSLSQVSASVRSRASQGVTLSSLGIGADYDARFLSSVADAGRGNYEFLANGGQLQAFLSRELQQTTRTTAQQVVAEVQLPAGWRLTRAYGTEPEGTTGTVRLPVGALFMGDTRTVVLDLAAVAGAPESVGVVPVALDYRAVGSGQPVRLAPVSLSLRAARTEAEVDAGRDLAVLASCESVVAAARQGDAMAAWQAGDLERANTLMRHNVAALGALQARAPSAALATQLREYQQDTATINATSAGSSSGQAYYRQSGATNRARMWRNDLAH